MFQRKLSPVSGARNVNDLIGILYERAWARRTAAERFGLMQMVADPGEATEIFARPDDFPKEYGVLPALGRSRFDAAGDEWAMRRDLTQPSYRDASRRINAPDIRAAYERRLSAMPEGACSDLDARLSSAAAEIFIEALNGATPGEDLAEALFGFRRLASIAQHLGMFGANQQQYQGLLQMIGQLRKMIERLILRDPGLVATLDRMKSAASARMSAFDAIGEVAINMLAGVETTTATIQWVVHCLARHPGDQARIREDILAHDMDSPALELFIQEAMRFFPAIPLLTRRTREGGTDLAGRELPGGALIALSIIGLHHNPDFWSEPHKFDGQRREFAENSYNRRAFVPFAAGQRVCGGLGLARLELNAAIASLLTHFEILPVTDDIHFEFAIALRPTQTEGLQLKRIGDGA